MQLTAKLTQLLPIETGISENGPWQKREIIVNPDGLKSSEVCIKLWQNMVCHPLLILNEKICINFYPRSSQFNGKWETDLIAISIFPVTRDINSTLDVEIIIESVLIKDLSEQIKFEKIKEFLLEQFHILGKSNDKYRNLMYLGMCASVDPKIIKNGDIINVSLNIESRLKCGWKTKIFVEKIYKVK